MYRDHKQKGMSLVELMVSITIGLVLMTGVVQLFLSSRTTFASQQALSRIQENGRLALDFIAKDVRMAGYMGCVSRDDDNSNIVNGLNTTTDYRYQFGIPIEGYDDDNRFDSSVAIADDTDALVVRGAGASSLTVVSFNAGTAEMVVEGQEANDCLGGVCDDDVVVISDCAQGRVFQITNLQANGSGVDGTRVVHAASGTPGNISPNDWGGQTFGAGAEVIKKSTIAYYIAPDAGEPSLWQSIDGNASPLLHGVEDMRVLYGVPGADGTIDYRARSAITNWADADIRGVQVDLLVRSAEDNVVSEPQPIQFAGVTVTPTDRRMRQVFSSIIAVRNRLQ